MDLSIVMPVFNNSASLAATLVRMTNACSGFDYEIIVVDNASDKQELDNMRSLLVANRRARLHENKVRRNTAASCNTGFRLARAEVVFFLEPEDSFNTNYIIRRLKRHQDTRIDIIFGNYVTVSDRNVRSYRFDYKEGATGADFLFIDMGDIRTSTISLRKKDDRRFLFPEFLYKYQDWGFLVNATNLGAKVAFDEGRGVFIRCGDADTDRCRMNIDASEQFIDAYLNASGRYISGFACKHLLASLYSENLQAFTYYSARTERDALSSKFRAIKLYGDCLARLGLFPLGGRLLRTAREGFRR